MDQRCHQDERRLTKEISVENLHMVPPKLQAIASTQNLGGNFVMKVPHDTGFLSVVNGKKVGEGSQNTEQKILTCQSKKCLMKSTESLCHAQKFNRRSSEFHAAGKRIERQGSQNRSACYNNASSRLNFSKLRSTSNKPTEANELNGNSAKNSVLSQTSTKFQMFNFRKPSKKPDNLKSIDNTVVLRKGDFGEKGL